VRFQDCFDAIDPASWRRSMYWDAEQPSDVFTQDGILHIISRRSEGYPNRSLSSFGYADQGGPRRVWRQGYFEARFKWPRGVGSAPAFWLMSVNDPENPNYPNPPCAVSNPLCLTAELDIFENFTINGANRFEGTIHRNTSGRWGVPDQTRHVFADVGFDMSTAFHTYAARWTATEVCWYLDERQLGCYPPFDSTNQDMFMTLYQWTGVYGPGPDSTTPDNLDMQVDWVRVWQR
jgi:beta-glucanase (GH16 family)